MPITGSRAGVPKYSRQMLEAPAVEIDPGCAPGRYSLRSPATLIDWLVFVLGLVAFVAGLIALVASLYTSDGTRAVGRHGHTPVFHGWQLTVLLVVFAGLVALHFATARRLRQVASLLTLGIALSGFVAWWWTEIDQLLGQRYLDTGHIPLGGGLVFSGIALGLQIVVGVMMFMAAFPLSDDAPSLRR